MCLFEKVYDKQIVKVYSIIMENTVGYSLKQIRDKKGLSQPDMANMINCTSRAYQSYERNERKPNMDILLGLHSNNINIAWVLTGQGNMQLTNHVMLDDILRDKVIDVIMLINNTLDTWLDEQNRDISSDKKNELVKLIYQQLEQDGDIDFETAGDKVDSIIKILKVA